MEKNTLKNEIASRLGLEVASDPKLLEECQKLCENYGISPQDLQFKWEAATFNSGTFTPAREAARFTIDSLAGVRTQIKRELEQGSGSAKKKTQVRSLASGVASINRNKMPFGLNRNVVAAQLAPEPQVKPELDLDQVIDFSPGGTRGQTNAGPSKVTFKGPKNDLESRKNRVYRYMFERTSERGEVLDSRIEEIAELVQTHYGIPEFTDPVNVTDEEIFVVGRITHDIDSQIKLTDATLTLETSRQISNHYGARIALRFDPAVKIRGGAKGAGALGLFPGAILAFKGRNGGANWFSVTEILALPVLLSSPSMKPSPDDDSFSMMIASGPFTPESDLSYKPWDTFTQIIKRSKPSVVLLLGPFVDALHPLIKAGDIDETPLDTFHRVFLQPLRDFLNSSPGSIAILVPSVRDLVNSHTVYPQSEFQKLVTKSDPRIQLVPNPGLFSINNISFGATSLDVLFHLRKEEIIKRGQEVESVPSLSADDNGADPLSNACRHLLQQRSFYPVFPVPEELCNEINLDVTHSAGLRIDSEVDGISPDVLILPSKYRQFYKNVNSTAAINPSTLVKGYYSSVSVATSAPGRTLKDRLNIGIVKLEE
ncbi:hypothetical protein D9757_003533 [Collybiopsis confluens]|uniref:DNA polymerase alpha subunit B n=1 Tax=Collybiopsis confluens TaxID=2823264 RepID=A0A8H5HTI6_9AGAR|nr:hypothetical protein D9757_003533 [Collybiopsis confluens]